MSQPTSPLKSSRLSKLFQVIQLQGMVKLVKPNECSVNLLRFVHLKRLPLCSFVNRQTEARVLSSFKVRVSGLPLVTSK